MRAVTSFKSIHPQGTSDADRGFAAIGVVLFARIHSPRNISKNDRRRHRDPCPVPARWQTTADWQGAATAVRRLS
jgi:hypothetical protein